MTENTFAQEIAQKAQLNAEAQGPFSAAIGVSESVAAGAAETQAVVGGDKLNLEIAKKKVAEAGAGKTTVELASKAIDAVGGTLDKFSKWFQGRGEGRKAKATTQEARVNSIRQEIAARQKTAEEQKILNAQAQAKDSNLSVNRGLWGETGGRVIDAIKGGFQENVDKKWNEYRAKTNEAVAQKFLNRAESFSKMADFAKEAAAKGRGLTQTIKGEGDAVSYSLEDQRKATGATEVGTAQETLDTSTDRAKAAADALERVRKEKYFMADAAVASKGIVNEGGDSGFTKTTEKTAEWSAMAAGTGSTS